MSTPGRVAIRCSCGWDVMQLPSASAADDAFREHAKGCRFATQTLLDASEDGEHFRRDLHEARAALRRVRDLAEQTQLRIPYPHNRSEPAVRSADILAALGVGVPDEPVRSFDDYRRTYFPAEYERERLAALSPEERARESIRDVLADACRHCGKLPEADGDHSCDCPHTDADCPDHPPGPLLPVPENPTTETQPMCAHGFLGAHWRTDLQVGVFPDGLLCDGPVTSVDPPKETGPTCKHGYTEAHSYEQGPGPVDGWRCPGPHKLPTVQADRRRRELAEHEAKHGPLCGHTDAEGCTGHGDF